MKTKKQQEQETFKQSLGYKLVQKMNLSSYDTLDYCTCYYEGDTPSLNEIHIAKELQRVLDELGIKE